MLNTVKGGLGAVASAQKDKNRRQKVVERDSIVLNTTEGRLGVVVSAVTFAQKDKSGQQGETKSNSERLLR